LVDWVTQFERGINRLDWQLKMITNWSSQSGFILGRSWIYCRNRT